MNAQSKRNHYGAAALIAAALGVSVLPEAQAQTEPQAQAQPQPQKEPASASGGNFYAFGGFAKLFAEKNSQLQGERGSPANLIAGGGYRVTPNLAAEINILVSERKVETPTTAQPAGTYAAGTLKSSMGTGGIGATVKYSFAVQRFAPYFGGGVGAYTTTFKTTSEAPGCSQRCRDTGPRVEASSRDVGIHALAGVDYHFTPKHVLAGEIRYLKLKADFGAIVPGTVDAGGTFLWMGYRRIF